MSQPMDVDEPGGESTAGFDPELDAVLKRVLQIIYKDHPLSPNQILVLSAELQVVNRADPCRVPGK